MSLAAFRPEQDWLECFEKHGHHYICVWRISQKVIYYPSIQDAPVASTIIVNRNGETITTPSSEHARNLNWDDQEWTRILEFQDGFYQYGLPADRYYIQFLRNDETHHHREVHWWAPEGEQLLLSHTASNEFSNWLTHGTNLLSDELQTVLEQRPRELSPDRDYTYAPPRLAPHSDRIRHMAYAAERRTRRRLHEAEDFDPNDTDL